MNSEIEEPIVPSAAGLKFCILLFLASTTWYAIAASSPGAYRHSTVTTSGGPMYGGPFSTRSLPGWTTTTYATQTGPFIGVALPTIAVAGSLLLVIVAWISYRSDKKAFVASEEDTGANAPASGSAEEPPPGIKSQAEPEPQNIVPTPAASDYPLQDLPDPIDGNQLAALEAAVENAIAKLAENPPLLTLLEDAPWGWSRLEIRTKSSAADARLLMLTKIGTLLGERQRRIMDAAFRMRFSLDGTDWDRDFGRPTSVLRLEFHVRGDEQDGQKVWKAGVAVGKATPTRLLVWEWGE